ncbi:hypothetical protein IQ13_3313 [Lacibacter cauensis]|uniref:Uncharacterized protein n=1 Tax=Lacibacter cauensis TaxID=510947 RepID=A0A562SI85_9BACT|nr:hypothetical protein IQ13_3313 [Lacibacter cauensis]
MKNEKVLLRIQQLTNEEQMCNRPDRLSSCRIDVNKKFTPERESTCQVETTQVEMKNKK